MCVLQGDGCKDSDYILLGEYNFPCHLPKAIYLYHCFTGIIPDFYLQLRNLCIPNCFSIPALIISAGTSERHPKYHVTKGKLSVLPSSLPPSHRARCLPFVFPFPFNNLYCIFIQDHLKSFFLVSCNMLHQQNFHFCLCFLSMQLLICSLYFCSIYF